MRTEYQLYIHGQWVSHADGCVRPDLEPATASPYVKSIVPVRRMWSGRWLPPRPLLQNGL